MTTPSTTMNSGKREKPAHPRHVSVTAVQKKHGITFPFTIAAPSFVLPAGVAENSRFLADYFPEICLLFYEAEDCLNYTEADLPPDLADLPVSWNVHLPLRIRWEDGADAVWQTVSGLMDKAAYLTPHAWVLHPPPGPGHLGPLADKMRQADVDPACFLVENVRGRDLCDIWPEIMENNYGACLDLGHVLAYGQHAMLELDGLWTRVKLLHVYGAEIRGKHWDMNHLGKAGEALLREVLASFQGEAITLEVFDETGLFQSLDRLAELMARWSKEK